MNPRRSSLAVFAAIWVWTAPGLTAQDAGRNAPTTASAALKTLTAEFMARRDGGGRTEGILPTFEQAISARTRAMTHGSGRRLRRTSATG